MTGTQPEPDVFAHIVDETVDSATLRTERLADVKRGYAPVRKTLVQRPNDEAHRPSVLGGLVRGRKQLPLRVLLLIYALEPILADARWPLKIWADLVGGTRPAPSVEAVSAALNALVGLKLISRQDEGNAVIVQPLLEDGSGDPYVRPTAAGAVVGPGYFVIPHEFWTTGLVDRLKLPGMAMFLVALHDTTLESTYQVSLERMPGWYGISERSAERGYGELSREGVLHTRTQMVRDRKMRTASGLRPVVHRALKSPYSKDSRAELQARTRAAARKAAGLTASPIPGPETPMAGAATPAIG